MNKALVLIAINLLTSSVYADEIIKNCLDGEVRSVDVSAEVVQIAPTNAKPEIIEIVTTKGKTTGVIARGPVLGSMDSPKLKTNLSCTKTGISLVATIVRSEHYIGATLQNQFWHPLIRVEITPYSSERVFEFTWKMQLTNGKEIRRARTPPYPDQEYPIVLTKMIRFTSVEAQ